jgi:hypothetical protein
MKHRPFVPETNDDEDRYADRRGSFSKPQPHKELGEVGPEVIRGWLAMPASGDFTRFKQAPRDVAAIARLNNPQAAFSIELVGNDPTV